MTRLQRWNAVQPSWWNRETFDALNRYFDDSYDRSTEWDSSRSWNLPLDVVEKEDAYVVRASIPGLDPDDLDITFNDNTLTVQAQTKHEAEDESERYMVRERRYGSFTRSIRFPMPVDGDQIDATCKNGELMLRLPKAENARPRRIAVKGDTSRHVIEAQTQSDGHNGGKSHKESVERDSKGWTEGYDQGDASGRGKESIERDSKGWTEGYDESGTPRPGKESVEQDTKGWTEGYDKGDASAKGKESIKRDSKGWTEGYAEDVKAH